MSRTKIVLKSGKDEAVLRQHPWVFSGAVKKVYGETNEGELVDVYNNKDRFLGLWSLARWLHCCTNDKF